MTVAIIANILCAPFRVRFESPHCCMFGTDKFRPADSLRPTRPPQSLRQPHFSRSKRILLPVANILRERGAVAFSVGWLHKSTTLRLRLRLRQQSCNLYSSFRERIRVLPRRVVVRRTQRVLRTICSMLLLLLHEMAVAAAIDRTKVRTLVGRIYSGHMCVNVCDCVWPNARRSN